MVREEEATEFCDSLNLVHMSTSSKTGEGVDAAYRWIATEIKNKLEE
jgi:hypothetical protein